MTDAKASRARTRLRTRSVDNPPVLLCLLGPAAVVTNGQLRLLDVRPKALALLVRLALGDGPQERDALAGLLFPDAANPRESLRWHLSHLRARVPMPIEADRRTIALDAPTDVADFRVGAERIVSGHFEDASKILALYRGDLCAGLRVSASADFDSWLYIHEDELRRTFRRATLSFAEWAVDKRRAGEALPSLLRLTEVDPYLEQAHVLLVRASEASGAADAARHAYDRYQRIVRKELHAEPRPELVRVYEAETPRGRTLPIDELVPCGRSRCTSLNGLGRNRLFSRSTAPPVTPMGLRR